MKIQVFFDDISQHISNHLKGASKSIYIAVAWFTDRELLGVVLDKVKEGIEVNILLVHDAINNHSIILLNEIEQQGGKVFLLEEQQHSLMHNKFCVIDEVAVITGSYNWSFKAQSNYENITIVEGDFLFAEQFVSEFKRIVTHCFGIEWQQNKHSDLDQIIKRLRVIKNVIQLDDIEDIQYQTNKLSRLDLPLEIEAIVKKIQQKYYSRAIQDIIAYLNAYTQLTVYIDPDIQALKIEIRMLEAEITGFSNEKAHIQKLFVDYDYQHSTRLGTLLEKILLFRSRIAAIEYELDKASQDTVEETKNDYDNFKQSQKEFKKQKRQTLSPEKEKNIKKMYRDAALLCHPDKVHEAMKEQAEALFVQLANAYNNNKIKEVENILNLLQTQQRFASVSEKVDEKKQLEAAVQKLRHLLQQYKSEIEQYQQRPIYKKIIAMDSWDKHFDDLEKTLNEQLERIKAKFEKLNEVHELY